MRRFNYLLWSGLALSIIAFISYFVFFARFPVTRDFPWVNLVLFVAAVALLAVGVRRAERHIVVAWIVTVVGVAVFAIFLFAIFVGSKWLPPSIGAPRVGQKAPDFTLLDTNRKAVSLSSLVASSPRGVLLIFYRGYW